MNHRARPGHRVRQQRRQQVRGRYRMRPIREVGRTGRGADLGLGIGQQDPADRFRRLGPVLRQRCPDRGNGVCDEARPEVGRRVLTPGQVRTDLWVGIVDELLQHLPRRGRGADNERGPHRLVRMGGQTDAEPVRQPVVERQAVQEPVVVHRDDLGEHVLGEVRTPRDLPPTSRPCEQPPDHGSRQGRIHRQPVHHLVEVDRSQGVGVHAARMPGGLRREAAGLRSAPIRARSASETRRWTDHGVQRVARPRTRLCPVSGERLRESLRDFFPLPAVAATFHSKARHW